MGMMKSVIVRRVMLALTGFLGGALSAFWFEGADSLCRAAGYIQLVN